MRAIVEEAELVGAADETLPPNDEAAPDADPSVPRKRSIPNSSRAPSNRMRSRPSAWSRSSTPRPGLTRSKKAELRVAVQVVANEPEARRRVLAVLEDILVPEAASDPAVQ